MDNIKIKYPVKKIENETENTILFSLNKQKPKENIYPVHDQDLEEEFDAIRSIN